jgi:hypothetical protein
MMRVAMSKIYYPLLHVEEVMSILNKIAIFGGLSDYQLYEKLEVIS